MRELFTHRVNGLNESINVFATSGPSAGNACCNYRIEPITDTHLQGAINPVDLHFQDGPPANGVNGISQEALLAVLIDRLEGFESGPFACLENSMALVKLKEAVHWLHHRTRERAARGVEGTHTK